MVSMSACAQNEPLLDILMDQMEAFNERDVARLVDNITDDFIWFSITSDTLMIEVAGKETFRTSMETYYESRPPIESLIESYTIDGNRISFKEVVSHDDENGINVSSSAMGIYEMRAGKIYRAWYFID
jgi:hypothetical protein